MRNYFVLAAVIVSMFSQQIFASSVAPANTTNTEIVYGPKVFFAALGKGKEYNDSFNAKSSVDGVVTVINGSGKDLYQVSCQGTKAQKLACQLENVARKIEVTLFRAKSVEISLNNQVVLSPLMLAPEAGKVQVAIRTASGTPVDAVLNKLKIKMQGTLFSQIQVDVRAQSGTVNQLPVARIVATPQNGIAPQSVSFSGLQSSDADGSISSYDWNFGDPDSGSLNTATGALPIHIFNVPGNYIVTLTVKDNQGASASVSQTISIIANVAPIARFTSDVDGGQAPLVVAFNGATSSDTDGSIISYQWDFGDGASASGPQVSHTFTQAGQYNVVLIVTDDKGATASAQKVIAVTPPNVPPIAVIKISRNQGIAPLMVAFDGSASNDSDGTVASYVWDFGDGSSGEGVRPTHEYATGNYTATLLVKDNLGLASSKVSVSISAVDPILPADPAQVAPALSSTQNSLPSDISKFLYTGDNPIQTGVVEGTIDNRFVAVIRGRLLQEDGSALSGVKVSVLGDARFGQTISREDGRFDLVVNGGGSLVINFERNGFYSVQRRVSSSHLGFATVDDIFMLRPDPKVTLVAMGSVVPQVAQGSMSSDSSGSRTAAVMIPSQTAASLKLADGSLVSVPQLHIRTKEYTVGPQGRRRMPAELPSTSAYTYAVELTADEVAATGAKGIQFSKPFSFYVENFLGFDPGDAMPVGIYNPDKGRWEPSQNGRVIKILSVQNGKAVLDVTGAGQASTADLAKLGIDDEELGVIGSSYQAGTSLWRTRLDHFSIQDINAYQEDVKNAKVPTGPPTSPTDQSDSGTCVAGSVIQLESRTLGESVAIPGTSFSLNYTTDRAPGRTAVRTLDIPITPNDMSAFPDFKGVDLKVVVAGQEYKESFSAAPSQSKRFTWDGKDVYGRSLMSGQLAEVSVGFRVSANYLKASSTASDESTFAFLGPGLTITSIPSREDTIFTRIYKTYLGANENVVNQALAGWSVNVHHVYDPVTQTLYTGDGFKRSVKDIGNIITTVVGSGTAGFSGDGGLATQAKISFPGEVTIGSDNSIYFKDVGNNRIRKVDPNGVISTIAGNGIYGFSGDGGPAIDASIGNYGGIAVDTEGEKTIYFSDYGFTRIRKISADGIISTIAGSGVPGFSGDGGPATSAKVNGPVEIVAKDGHVYFNDAFNNRVRVIRPNGTIQTVAGNGVNGFSGDGGPAVDAAISQPLGLALGPNGDIYITDSNNARVRRIDRSGIIRTVAGGGSNNADGIPATEASLNFPTRVVLSKDNTMYISTPTSPTVRRVGPDGIITTFAGTADAGAGMSEGELAGRVNLIEPYVMAIGPDDSIYVVEQQQHKIKKISRAFPSVGSADIVIPSSDGSELYIFDPTGRHLSTKSALTGAIKYSFSYTSSGRLASISDGDGNVTTVVRNSAGEPTQIIAPFGQVTNLTVGNDGYLSSMTNMSGETYSMTYTSGGLLSSFAKPRGNTSTFTYDSVGQLVKDQNAAGGFTYLNEILNASGYSIPFSTAEGRSSSVSVQKDAFGRQVSSSVDPDGLVSYSTNDFKGNVTEASPTRSVASVSKSDPRIGAVAQYAASQTVSLSSGETLNQSTSRAVAYQANDLFSFTQLDTTVTNGFTSTMKYDSVARTFTSTSAMGRQQKVVIDGQERPVLIQVPDRSDQVFAYNNRGLLAQVSQGARTKSFTYDSKGRVATETNALGQVTSYAYDNSDRVIEKTFPDGRVVVTSYDANGNIIGVTPAGKPKHIMGFDLVDMVTSYLPPLLGGPEVTQYTYNLDKQIKSKQTPDGLFANYVYVAGSNRLQKISTDNGDYQFAYDPSSGLVSQALSPDQVTSAYTYHGDLLASSSNSGQALGDIAFTHNSDFRVSSSNVNGASLLSYTYDKDGLLKSVGPMNFGYDALNGSLANSLLLNIETLYSYDQLGDLSSVAVSHLSGTAIYNSTFTRDVVGRILSKSETVNGVTSNYSYQYDSSGRLTDATKNGVNKHYNYDSNGNRLSEVLNGVTIAGEYNNQDQLLSYGSATYSYKPGGNLATKTKNSGVSKYTMDVFGNLKSVELPNGNTISYIVDSQNRRVGKAINGVKSKYWVYESQLRIAAEVSASGAPLKRFIYGQGHAPEAMIIDDVAYKFITDQLGSVRLVVNGNSGAIVQQIEYDEFGKVISDSNPGFQPFGFAGGLYDVDTGLVRFGVRDYDAEVGRWTSKDPIGFDGGDFNLYGYVLADPINIIDPEGLSGLRIVIPDPKPKIILPRPGDLICPTEGPCRPVPRPKFLDPVRPVERPDGNGVRGCGPSSIRGV